MEFYSTSDGFLVKKEKELNIMDTEMDNYHNVLMTLPLETQTLPFETSAIKIIDSQAEHRTGEIMKWDEGQTSFMLHLYAENIANVGPLKKFRKKINMWNFLAEEICKEFKVKITALQVLTRYQCVIKRTKKALDNNNTSGAIYKATGYEQEKEASVAHDDSLLPQFQLGQEEFRTKKIATTPKKRKVTSPSSSSSASTSEIAQPSEFSNIFYVDDEPSPSPRKTPLDKFSQKFFEQKKKQLEQAEKVFREAAEAKKLRFEEKERNKAQRHNEKMQRLAEISKRQQRIEELLIQNRG